MNATATELQEGLYAHDGIVFRVVRSKSSGHLYATRKTDTGWEYAPGAVRVLDADELQEPVVAREVTVTDPGVYERDGDVFKVQKSKMSERLYAKRLVPAPSDRLTESGERERWEFEYAPGAVYDLSPDDRMSLDEAKTFGIRFGICANCGRGLKTAESVERGIGPVCAKWFTF